MSDKELIIRLLENVERRIRASRLLQELTRGVSVFLLLPICFKILDMISPFRGGTVAVVLGLWVAGLAGYVIWRFRRRESLAQVAAALDRKLSAHDEMKSAYWFITSPEAARQASEWIDLQLSRAAKRTQRIDVKQLYPWSAPSASYMAAALLMLIIGLNFAPLPGNHNWLYLQAAPASSLNQKEALLLLHARDLLRQAEQSDKSEIAQRVEGVERKLQNGEITLSEALQQLRDIRNLLEAGSLDTNRIGEALDEMAEDLEKSEQMKDAAKAMKDRNLLEAAAKMLELAERMGMLSPGELEKLMQSLEQASSNDLAVLQDIARDLKQAADALKSQDKESLKQALEKGARDLQSLDDKIRSQQLKNAAILQIQDLAVQLRRAT